MMLWADKMLRVVEGRMARSVHLDGVQWDRDLASLPHVVRWDQVAVALAGIWE